MNKKKPNFITELITLKKKFIKYAQENSHKVDLNTFEINIANGYLTLRMECEDEYEDCIVFYQEIEMDNDKTYQNHLLPMSIHIEY